MIHKNLLDKNVILSYQKQLSQNGFCVIENLIDIGMYKSMLEEIHSKGVQVSQIHATEYKYSKDVCIISSKLYDLHNFFYSESFLMYIGLIFGNKVKRKNIQDIFKDDPGYLGKKGIAGQMYDNGCFFDWHTDGHIGEDSLGAFTYYLFNNGITHASDGGTLEIKNEFILPVENSIVLVKSGVPHRVTKVQKKAFRISLQSMLIKQ